MENYKKAFLPYGLAAFLVGCVGGFSAVLGPAFVADLGLPDNNTTWTALAQAMSTAACAPILGKLGDMLGRRRTLLAGIAVFSLGNLMSALANSLSAMLAARFILGIGSAAIAPVILSFIVTQFPPQQVAKGFSAYMLISSAAVILGPTLGSLIIAASGWRATVWLCVALCGAVAGLVLALPERTTPMRRSLAGFDWPGAVLVFLFFSLVLCVPSFGQNLGWTSVPFLAVLLGAVAALAGLAAAERRAKSPILPGHFMTRPAFLLSVLVLFLTQGLLQANMTAIILFVSYTRGSDAALSGYAISVLYLGMALGSLVLGPQAGRFAPKRVLTVCLLLTALGCGSMLMFSEKTPPILLMLSLGLLGLGLGGNATVLMKVALWGLNPQQAGVGAGTYGLFRDLAAPLGVAVLVPLFTNSMASRMAAGTSGAAAAVGALHRLSAVELGCVAAGLAAVLALPAAGEKS